MIPTIEDIVEGMALGQYTKSQAVTWLHEHAAGAANELRDYFAGKAMQSLIIEGAGFNSAKGQIEPMCDTAYMWADGMLKVRG